MLYTRKKNKEGQHAATAALYLLNSKNTMMSRSVSEKKQPYTQATNMKAKPIFCIEFKISLFVLHLKFLLITRLESLASESGIDVLCLDADTLREERKGVGLIEQFDTPIFGTMLESSDSISLEANIGNAAHL